MKNPYDWLKPTPDLFYGHNRLEMIEEVVAGLKRGESFSIVGGRRLGKTTFLLRLYKQIAMQQDLIGLFPVYLDAQNMPGASSAAEAMDWIKRSVGASINFDLTRRDEQLGEWVIRVVEEQKRLRLVLLIDEFDSFREYEWHHIFFNNLRALIHNRPGISEKLSIVVTGGRAMQNLRESPGSPLANVLTWKYLSLLNKEDIKRLVHLPTGSRFHSNVGEAVWKNTGGHPFIAQYLMYHLCVWNEEGMNAEEALKIAERKFLEEHDIVFKQWWFDHLEEDERDVYRVLQKRKSMNVIEIARKLGCKVGIAGEHLRTLSYIGLVQREGDTYSVAGEMFDKWVRDNDVKNYAKTVPASHSLHELFDELETRIRRFVIDGLREIDQLKNLPEIFPNEIEKAMERYKEESGSDLECPLEEILIYSDFALPFEIILKFWKNFYETFPQELRDQTLGRDPNKAKLRFEERKDVLTKIRNALRHARPITDEERHKARVFCRDILSLIKTFGGSYARE
jgi:predicted transcriptional regulator